MSHIIVDDADPAIKYTGDFELGPALSGSFRPGFFFDDTFHHLNDRGNLSTLSYDFEGSQFLIGGAINLKGGKEVDITVVCLVDGVTQPPPPPMGHVGVLCYNDKLLEGPHTISLTVTAPPGSQSQVWVDFIRYQTAVPPSGPSRNVVFPGDPNIRQSKNWFPSSTNENPASFRGNQTTVANEFFNIKFHGNSLSWLNCPYDTNTNLSPSDAMYTIDSKFFTAQSNNGLVLFNQQLKDGNHLLQVTYKGLQNQMPLTFCGLVYGTVNATSSGLGGNSTSQGTHGHPDKTSEPIKAGRIVGAVIGGIALGMLIVLAVFLFRRYRRRHLPPSYRDSEMGRGTPPLTYVVPALPGHWNVQHLSYASTLSSPAFAPQTPQHMRPRSPSPSSSLKYASPTIPKRSSLSKSIYSIASSFRPFRPSAQTAQVGSEWGSPPPSPRRGRHLSTFDIDPKE